MSLYLLMTQELEERIEREAALLGLTPAAYVLTILHNHVPQAPSVPAPVAITDGGPHSCNSPISTDSLYTAGTEPLGRAFEWAISGVNAPTVDDDVLGLTETNSVANAEEEPPPSFRYEVSE